MVQCLCFLKNVKVYNYLYGYKEPRLDLDKATICSQNRILCILTKDFNECGKNLMKVFCLFAIDL